MPIAFLFFNSGSKAGEKDKGVIALISSGDKDLRKFNILASLNRVADSVRVVESATGSALDRIKDRFSGSIPVDSHKR